MDDSRRPSRRKPRQPPSKIPLDKLSCRPPSVKPIDFILCRLKNVTDYGFGNRGARCPAHADTRNSLSVTEAEAGKVLLHCHAGCSFEEIVEALGISAADLFPDGSTRTRTYYPSSFRTQWRTYRGC